MNENPKNLDSETDEAPANWGAAIVSWIVMALVCVILPQALVKALFIFSR